jgi:ABC-2 type transport system permease protein
VYGNSGRAVPVGIIRSIVEGITNQITTGNITVAATIDTLVARAQSDPAFGLRFLASSQDGSFQPNFACAFTPAFSNLKIDQQSVTGQKTNNAVAILVVIGSAQAMFFALFTGQQGVLSIFEERRQWTLQRLIVSPTPRVYILLGKLVGTFCTCLFQLTALAIALTLVGSILNGSFTLIWGNNFVGIGLMLIMASLAVTGLGVLMAGIAKTPEQSAVYAQLINIALALLGGSFGFQLPEGLSRLSMIYWGADGFRKLSLGQGDITLNLLVLLAHGVILFGLGYWLFSRRLDI